MAASFFVAGAKKKKRSVCALSGREAMSWPSKRGASTVVSVEKAKRTTTQLLLNVGQKPKKKSFEEKKEELRGEGDVVARLGDRIEIVCIRDDAAIAAAVDAELGASTKAAKGKTYAALEKGLVVGAIFCEPATAASVAVTRDLLDAGGERRTVDLGVDKIWVRPSRRRQGVASALVDAALRHFFFNFVVPPDRFAVSQPTADGRALFTAYLNRHLPQDRASSPRQIPLLVYDKVSSAGENEHRRVPPSGAST